MAKSQILFLGTGGDIYTIGKQMRASGGILLEVGGNQFLIDPGPGSLVAAKEYGINLRKTVGLIVTHAHMNHSGDANAVISAMTHSGLDKTGVLVANKTAYNGDENHTQMISEFHKGCVEKSIAVEPDQRIGINQIEIQTLSAKHNDPNTVGLKFYTPEFVLSYSSDTEYTKELIDDYKKSDILILNVVNPFDFKKKWQLNSEDAVTIISKAKPRLAVINHFGIKMLNADPIAEAREIQKRTGIQTISAHDGMTINPISYSANMKQKSLKSY